MLILIMIEKKGTHKLLAGSYIIKLTQKNTDICTNNIILDGAIQHNSIILLKKITMKNHLFHNKNTNICETNGCRYFFVFGAPNSSFLFQGTTWDVPDHDLSYGRVVP